MNEIKILELTLRNFKGIKDFTLSPEGKNVNIYGDNATGKTTIMDSFLWLLFDKDSQNSSNFNIKTLDEYGNVIHGLEHEVSAKLEIDNKVIELQKIYKEKWTKKRGEAERTLTGHTTDYFINDVPKKKSEYENYLSQIIDEDTFKILTNPLHFNTNLHWKDRRNLALNICGEVDQDEIFNKDKKLIELKPLLVDKTIDDLKAEMTARRRKLNEELKSIPYRIDELSREDVEVDVDTLTKEKKELESKLNEIKNSKGIDYNFRLRGVNGSIELLENELKKLEQDLTKDLRRQLNNSMEQKSKVSKDYYQAKTELEENTLKIGKLEKSILEVEAEISKLRNEFKEVAATKFAEGSIICPTCKQNLPVEDVEKLIKEFEEDKQNKLNSINKDGKQLNKQIEIIEDELEGLKLIQESKVEVVEKLETELAVIDLDIKNFEERIAKADVTELEEYKEIQNKLEKLYEEKEEVEKLAEQQDNSKQILELESQIAEINKELARVDLAKENEKRIEQLKDRERELAQMVAKTEKIEFLCDQYIITKAELLEDKLNSKFKTVKFKLFDIQVNGGINETFVTTVNGVPFEDLNNAMKINAGLDIINTLTDYYNFKAPIFIDNRESVNEIVDVKSQVINLIVSKHKNLRVEVEG